MTVLGTPWETVLFPVNSIGPLIMGFILSPLPERNAISHIITAAASTIGRIVHGEKIRLFFFIGGAGAISCNGSWFSLKSCQLLYPSMDTNASRVDGCGV